MLDSVVKARGGSGAPTGADSAALRAAIPGMIAKMIGADGVDGPSRGPTQCHDITLYPAIGYGRRRVRRLRLAARHQRPGASGAHRRGRRFELLILALGDVQQRRHQGAVLRRMGRRRRSRSAARPIRSEWGADAIFTIDANNKMHFQGYYKMPAPQTSQENCVAHNGSLIPIPGRDVMVQAWYQGGISVFDWTDAAHAKEIAFFDRGPVDADAHGDGRFVVRLLVQRRTRELRDRARARRLRAHAEPVAHAERDRRGEDRCTWIT